LNTETPTVKQIDWNEGFPVTAGHINLGMAEASPETREYWEGVVVNELRIKRCLTCRTFLHPRRMGCPDCARAGLEWVRSSGKGRVYSYSTVTRAPNPQLEPSVPYCVGIVHLEEDVYLFTRFIVPKGTEPDVDDAATLEFKVLENGQKLPVFVVAGRNA
jgi:uncharacterized OB-fold protein